MIDAVDRIVEIMDAAFDPAWGEAWTRAQISDSLAFPHTHFRLLDRGGCDANDDPARGEGFTLVRAAPGEEELLLIAVHPDARGRGLGRLLLDGAASAARDRGATRIFLEMRANNPARSLYLACGYEPIGIRREYYRIADGSRLDAITFARQLDTDAASI